MIVKLFTETLEEQPAWINLDVDKHSINGYWNVPAYIDGDGLLVPSDEWNIIISGTIMTVKDCDGLIFFLKYKFEK